MKRLLVRCVFILTALSWNTLLHSEEYIIDTEGMHAAIQFKVKHLGYSWLVGRFNNFDGQFTFDEKRPEKNQVTVNIDVRTLDTNHAERDKHLRDARFLDTAKFPKASFISDGYSVINEGKGILTGTFTLRGVSKKVDIEVIHVGAGKDPWGGYRRGFEGYTTLHLSDYNMAKANTLGPEAEKIEVYLSVEGIRK